MFILALAAYAASWLYLGWQLCHAVRLGEIYGGLRRNLHWIAFESEPVMFVVTAAVYAVLFVLSPWALFWWGNWHYLSSRPSFWDNWEPKRRISR